MLPPPLQKVISWSPNGTCSSYDRKYILSVLPLHLLVHAAESDPFGLPPSN